jgi:uncharacterized protein with PIN domain
LRLQLDDVEHFLVDCMLMRLARWMRMLGLDVANPACADDSELMQRALSEGRTLLTRDRLLAERCRAAGANCILIESSALEDQLKELSKKGMTLELKPMRCTLCNAPLRKAESLGKEVWQCQACGKQYWEGAHWRNMEKVLDRVRFGLQ